MIKDSERGLGYLLAHEEPETKARRVAEIKRQFESSSPVPLSEPSDVFTSLPFATEVKLGSSNSLVTPEITSPVKPKIVKTNFGNVKIIPDKKKKPSPTEFYKGYMSHLTRPKLTEQEKEFWGAWNNGDKMLKYVKKYTDVYAGDKGEEKPKKSIPDQLKDLRHFGRNRLIERTEKDKTNINQKRKI